MFILVLDIIGIYFLFLLLRLDLRTGRKLTIPEIENAKKHKDETSGSAVTNPGDLAVNTSVANNGNPSVTAA